MSSKPVRRKQDNFVKKSFQNSSFQTHTDLQLQLGSDLHRAGKLKEAKLIYEELLKNNPNKFEILHLPTKVLREDLHFYCYHIKHFVLVNYFRLCVKAD
jgi:hypothetical protein